MSLVNTELVEENSRHNNKQIFIVSYNGENNMLMETEGPAETAEWIKAFKEHIAHANNQTAENVYRESRRLPSEVVNNFIAASVNSEKSTAPASPNPNANVGRALPPMYVTSHIHFDISYIFCSSNNSKDNDESSEPTRTTSFSTQITSPIAPAPTTTAPTTTSTSATEESRESRAMRTASIRLETEMDVATLANKVFESILSLGTDAQYRNEFIQKLVPRLISTAKSFGENCLDGAIGNRGEKTVGIIAFLLFIILFTNAPKLSFLVRIFTKLFTTLLMLIGLSMISNSMWELEEQNSVFLTPATNHKLVKTGIYRLVRHYKIVLTIGLFVILVSYQVLFFLLILLTHFRTGIDTSSGD
jgi:protein-S-isoprenylcysteine O-methyltransferase Ste14